MGRRPTFQDGSDVSDEYVLEFEERLAGGGRATIFAAWSTSTFPHVTRLPGVLGCYAISDMMGEPIAQTCDDGGHNHYGIHVNVSDAPIYIRSIAPGDAQTPALKVDDAVPSLLVGCPQTPTPFPGQWISMGWMKAIANGSATGTPIQVDFATALSDLNRSRVFNYSAVLLFESPGASLARGEPQNPPVPPTLGSSFASMLQEYVQQGGGVFLFPSDDDWKGQMLDDVTDAFGLRLPVEMINETNPANVGSMNRFAAPLAFTSAVTKHPTTEGVSQLWYPTNQHYNAGETVPLCLTPSGPDCDGPSNWTALVRASPTAVTQGTTPGGKYRPLPPSFFQRATPEKQPPIFAVRTMGKGKVAVLAQWRQYTIGSGDGWLFDDQILSRGVGDRKSDTGKLIHNTIKWLSTPVPQGPGGFKDSAHRLVFPNDVPSYRDTFLPPAFTYDPAALDKDPASTVCELHGQCSTVSGVIGVRTAASSGTGSVADYAKAAAAAGLGFVVFTEEWSMAPGKRTLTDAAIAKMKADCAAHSTPQLTLIPGMSIENNIGNKQIFVGPGNWTPPADTLTNDSSRILLQGVDPLPPHNYTGFNTPSFNWMLSAANSYHPDASKGWTVGYYHLGPTRAAGSLSMPDLRCFSMAAVAYYDSTGALVEELEEEFAFTVESTIAPVPVAVSEIKSVSAFEAAVKTQMLTHVRGKGAGTVFIDGLRWNSQYDALPTYVSHAGGPAIDAWPNTNRVYTLGAERFVTGSALMQAPISVRANTTGATISEINITNGRRLFRRFLPKAEAFTKTLLLDGYVHANYVLTAVDSAGRKAFGTPLRTWKPGPRSVVFCGDQCVGQTFRFFLKCLNGHRYPQCQRLRERWHAARARAGGTAFHLGSDTRR